MSSDIVYADQLRGYQKAERDTEYCIAINLETITNMITAITIPIAPSIRK